MEEAKFTWFPKLTATAARVPDSQRGALLWALAVYGTTGQEPDLEWPLDALFESLREDIDNSKRAISAGKTGGRGKRKEPSSDSEDPFQESETPLYGDANPPLDDDEKVYTGVSEPVNGGSGKAEPKPYQTIPIHTKPKKERARFTPPTVEDRPRPMRQEGLHLRPGGLRGLLRIEGLDGREEPDEVVAGGVRDVAEAGGAGEGR